MLPFLIENENGELFLRSVIGDLIEGEELENILSAVENNKNLSEAKVFEERVRSFLHNLSMGEDNDSEYYFICSHSLLNKISKDYQEEFNNLFKNSTPYVKKEKETSETFVYIMKDSNTSFYKIGHSVDPCYREKTLQSEKPCITLINKWKGRVSDETFLHKKFKDKRIRGEWFDLKIEDIEEIKKYFNEKK